MDELRTKENRSDTIWMNSMTCRKCLYGRYIGYDGGGNSGPCDKCGDTQPEKMTRDEYLAPWEPNVTREPIPAGADA